VHETILAGDYEHILALSMLEGFQHQNGQTRLAKKLDFVKTCIKGLILFFFE
jgi:hypothetical protein